MTVFPSALWDKNVQSIANDGPANDTLAQGADYNEVADEVAAIETGLRTGVLKAFWNDLGLQLDAGDLVFISGWNAANSLPTVTKANAVIAGGAIPLLAQFVVIADVLDAAAGNMAKEYTVTGLDTSAITTVGDPVYLSGTAGEFSATAQNPANENSKDRNVRQRIGVMLVKNALTGVIHFVIEEEDLLETARFDGWSAASTTVAGGVTINLTAQVVDKYGVNISGRYMVFFSLVEGLEWDDSGAGAITVTENTAVRAGQVSANAAEIYYTGSTGLIDLDFDKAAAGTGWVRLNGADGAVKTATIIWT